MSLSYHYLVVVLMIGLFGCVTNDKKKPESPLATLNGDKYQPAIGGVSVGGMPLSGPFVTRKNSDTIVTGKIVENRANGMYRRPYKFQTVIMKREKVELKTSTNEYGEFRFAGDIANGHWEIRLATCADQTKLIDVNTFEIDSGEWEVVCVRAK